MLAVVSVHTAFDWVVITILYLFGTALCTAFRWGLWMQKQPAGTSWGGYWRSHAATNLVSLTVAVVVGALWLTGNLLGVATLFQGLLANVGVTLPTDQVVPVEYGTALAAGFFFDLTSRFLVRAIQKYAPDLANGDTHTPPPPPPAEAKKGEVDG